jgi:uncharacterized protein YutE (UPF0331/DUF86 family)
VVDKERIEQRLLKLEQTVRKLKEISTYTWEEYCQDEGLRDRSERNLQVAAQTCIDIANHLIAAYGFRTPLTYGESFEVLRDEGIIPADLAVQMKKIAGFRNILVHDYLEIDQEIVYAFIKKLADFKTFAQCIYKSLE